ncbi:MAG: SMP-30/gluconolactonase/LRE family protein [Pseudolabrys sp.]
MFAAPQVIKTEVFAEVPQSLRKTDIPLERLAAGRGRPPAGCTLEGPSFDRAGNLYFVDNTYGRIFRADPSGQIEVIAEYDGEPNGLKLHKDGRIFVADYRHGIVTVDPATGKVTPVVSRYMTDHFRGVNDLVFSKNGDLYFTDQGQTDLADPNGSVYCYSADGKLRKVIGNAPSPNGLVFNLEEDILFVATTRSNAIWRVPLTPSGAVSRLGVFLYLSGGVGPDGLALDESGGLAIAHPGMGVVWVFSARGEPLYRVESCRGDKPTNIAYGGPDRRTLYIMEAATGSILTARLPSPGRAMYSHS